MSKNIDAIKLETRNIPKIHSYHDILNIIKKALKNLNDGQPARIVYGRIKTTFSAKSNTVCGIFCNRVRFTVSKIDHYLNRTVLTRHAIVNDRTQRIKTLKYGLSQMLQNDTRKPAYRNALSQQLTDLAKISKYVPSHTTALFVNFEGSNKSAPLDSGSLVRVLNHIYDILSNNLKITAKINQLHQNYRYF